MDAGLGGLLVAMVLVRLYEALEDLTVGATRGLAPCTGLQLLFLPATLAVVGSRRWRRGAEAHPAEPEKVAV